MSVPPSGAVWVYPNGGGTGTQLTLASQGPDGGRPASGRWERNTFGSIDVTVPFDDPALGLLVEGALLVVRVDDAANLGEVYRIEGRKVHDTGSDEEAGREVTVTGVGLFSEWADAILHPVNGYDRRPFSDVVLYNFAHPDFDDSGWHGTVYPILDDADVSPDYPVVVQRHSLPMEQPDPYAQWVASRAEDDTLQFPVASMFFRRPETFDGDVITLSYTSSDDSHVEWMDGTVSQVGERDPGYSFADTYRAARRASAGAHVRAIEVQNFQRPFPGNVLNTAGLINSFFAVDSLDSILDDTTFVSQTGTPPGVTDGWVCTDNFDDPTKRPGFTFGAMWTSVHTRAQAEGEMLQWVLGFTATTDSAGAPWELETEFAFNTLDDLWVLLKQCADTHVDLGYTINLATGVRTLLAFNKGTAGDTRDLVLATARYLAGISEDPTEANVVALDFEVDGTSVVDRLAYRHANGFSRVEQSPAAGFPRRSGSLKLGAVDDPEEARRIAEVTMQSLALPQTQIKVEADPVGGDVAGVDFVPFDTVTAVSEAGEPVPAVVHAVAWEIDEFGFYQASPELNDPIRTAAERAQVTLKRMTPGTLGGRSAAASPERSDVEGIQTGKLPKYRDLKFNFSGTATVRITGFSELKERRRLTNLLVTAQPQPDDSGITITGSTTVNLYTADGTIQAFAVLPETPNWSDDGEPSYRVEVRLGGGFFQEQTKFFAGIPTSGGHYNIVMEVASTDPL